MFPSMLLSHITKLFNLVVVNILLIEGVQFTRRNTGTPKLSISEGELEKIFQQIQGQGRPGAGSSRVPAPAPAPAPAPSASLEVDGFDRNGALVIGTITIGSIMGQGHSTVETKSASAKALSRVLPASETSLKSQANANLLLAATRLLLTQNKIPNFGLPGRATGSSGTVAPESSIDKFELPSSRSFSILPQPSCIQEYVECDFASKYRTYTGVCNNVFTPELGIASSTFRSQGTFGQPLPSSRSVSLNVHSTQPKLSDPQHTQMLMLWGQFLAHDISLSPQATASYGGILDCEVCNARSDESNNSAPSSIGKGDCFPIPIEKKDPFYGKMRKQCMGFTRSLAGQLTIGPREQLNQISSFIDASNVYGSESSVANNLRSFNDGELKTGSDSRFLQAESCSKDSEPTDAFFPVGCPNCGIINRRSPDETKGTCFKAGDSRNSENPALASMHTMWHREHNRIAKRLKQINRSWNDEITYQETRRIIGAMHQHITYNEYLPEVFGKRMWNRSKLSQAHKGYLPCDPTVSNEFATAAYRFGHSIINSPFKLNDGGVLNLHEHFFNGSFLHESPDNMQKLVMGMTRQNSQLMDRFLEFELRNRLFGDLDLASLNVQRGRDHGLQPYVKYRDRFHLSVPETWRDLVSQNIMDENSVRNLSNTYRSVSDIDLYTGLLTEKPMPGSIIGELLGRILTDQFGRLKDCDRFFYKNSRETGAFSERQLQELEKVTLSSLVCQNIGKDSVLPTKVMQTDSSSNPAIPCFKHPTINFDYWKDESVTQKVAKMRRRKIKPRCLPNDVLIDFISPRPIG